MKRMVCLALQIGAGIMGAFVAASAASAEDERVSDAPPGFVMTGDTQRCLNMRSTDITAIDEDTLLFQVGVSNYYLNKPRGRCTNADSPFNRIEIRRFSSGLCSGEILHIVDNRSGIYQGSCALGEFERLEKAPPAPAPVDGAGDRSPGADR